MARNDCFDGKSPAQIGKLLFKLNGTTWRNANFSEPALAELVSRTNTGMTEVLARAVALAELETPKGVAPVVTAVHVRQAMDALKSFGNPKQRKGWITACQVAEYIAAAVTGWGAGRFDLLGSVTFVSGLCIGGLLIAIRMLLSQRD